MMQTFKILKSVLKYIFKLRTLDVNFIFNFITSTIAIIAILTAFNMFSKKPEIDIKFMYPGSKDSKPEANYKPDQILEFYSDYKFKFPNILKPILIVSKEDSLSNFNLTIDWTDPKKILNLLKNRPNTWSLDDYVRVKTDDLEKSLGDLRVKGTVMIGGDYGWSEWKFRKILSELKNAKISEKDYYMFLCAGINRRTIKQTIRVENTGDVDLKEFNLVIHSPFSRITKSRTGNIISADFLSARTLFSTKRDSQSTTLSFQNLPKDESVFVDVTTRENMLIEADIGYSYKEENILDTKALWINTIIIFVIMVFLSVFFKAKKE